MKATTNGGIQCDSMNQLVQSILQILLLKLARSKLQFIEGNSEPHKEFLLFKLRSSREMFASSNE
jgi:hypothetical protein